MVGCDAVFAFVDSSGIYGVVVCTDHFGFIAAILFTTFVWEEMSSCTSSSIVANAVLKRLLVSFLSLFSGTISVIVSFL